MTEEHPLKGGSSHSKCDGNNQNAQHQLFQKITALSSGRVWYQGLMVFCVTSQIIAANRFLTMYPTLGMWDKATTQDRVNLMWGVASMTMLLVELLYVLGVLWQRCHQS
ncbi:hypothetical protein F5Y16DRAFT_332571 [Xylariaceae sp. FL0255]|nr:hypothetical protein F5Y16DRAFT_332571 [Xylariaceae sp. FL0255]